MLLIVVTFICYVLTRKLKDNGGNKASKNTDNPFQAKLYKINFVKKLVKLFMPKAGTPDYRKVIKLMKDSASHSKIEWLYINKLLAAVCTFVVVFLYHYKCIVLQKNMYMSSQHQITIFWVI